MALTASPPRLGRLERAALQGVIVREVVNYSSFWRSSTFSSTVDPTIYLLAFGFGFGSLVSQVAGYDYIDFVGTGIVATTVLFSGAFPAMYSTFVKYEFQRTYDAILAAPVDTEELVTAEALWIATRAGVYGCVPMLVAIVFGLDPAWGMLVVPLIAWIAGFGWACFGIAVAGTPTSLAAIDLGLTEYDPDRVHGHRLTRARIEQALARREPRVDCRVGRSPPSLRQACQERCLCRRQRRGRTPEVRTARALHAGRIHDRA